MHAHTHTHTHIHSPFNGKTWVSRLHLEFHTRGFEARSFYKPDYLPVAKPIPFTHKGAISLAFIFLLKQIGNCLVLLVLII